uniref:Lateral signaling target protein 2 homolog n=1 Tax=Lepeophtheirus salmonis TaxID=72036 RepID=A0A0K2U3Q5_LEPSM
MSVGLSFTMFHARDFYPRKTMVKDGALNGGKLNVEAPFNSLPGEDILYLGLIHEDVIAGLSNYRLFVDCHPRINLPLGLLDFLEQKDLFWIHIHTKDGRYTRFQCQNSGIAEEWLRRISSLSNPSSLNLEDVFAFAHAAWYVHEQEEQKINGASAGNEDEPYLLSSSSSSLYQDWFHSEIARLRFDIQGAWRISRANKDYQLCSTYPEELLIPFCISDAMLEKIAQFRSARRIPAILWRHRTSGAVLARCSQPEVGWLGWRSTEDEQMVKALADACAYDKGNIHLSSDEDEEPQREIYIEQQKKVLIIDARSFAAAFGNRARGGGVECAEYYPNTEIEFMSLANIHYIRKSFHALRNLVNTPTDPSSWFGALDGTKWLTHMSGLLKSAVRCTTALEIEGRPVIVHCSDGWDRTPQIVSLSQLLLDPYYRTCDGFRVLVEKEWLDFGHKMADRCGLAGCSSDPNERSPIFLQWLDCVHQLLLQFPCTFEFNQSYLVKLAQHTYSSLFGTFLCNNQQERRRNNVSERTRSIWTYLNDNPDQFLNYLYKINEDTLWPKCEVRDLSLWKYFYVCVETRTIFPVESSNPSSGDSSADGSEVDVLSSSESSLVKESSGNCQVTEPGQNGDNGIYDNKKNNSGCPSLSNVIESSTDTLVPEDSSKNSHLSDEGTFPLDADGLVSHKDSVQSRLAEINASHRSQIRALEQQLYEARISLRRLHQKQSLMNDPKNWDQRKSEGEDELEEDEQGTTTQSGSTTSDLSWEAVDEKEITPILWVPDHAGAVCMGCNSKFWFGRRKHHCRSCGLLFCNNCTDQFSPIPTEQLYSPVRVCDDCYATLKSSSSSSLSTLQNGTAALISKSKTDSTQNLSENESKSNSKILSEGVVVEQLC